MPENQGQVICEGLKAPSLPGRHLRIARLQNLVLLLPESSQVHLPALCLRDYLNPNAKAHPRRLPHFILLL